MIAGKYGLSLMEAPRSFLGSEAELEMREAGQVRSPKLNICPEALR